MSKRTVLAALALVILAALLATRDYDATVLGRTALAQAREATGLSLEAEGARFRPLRGLELQSVHAAAGFRGGRYDVSLRGLRLEHRLGSILRGRLDVDRLVLAEPRIVVTLGAEARSTPSPPPRVQSPPPPSDAGEAEEGTSPQPRASTRLRFTLSEIRIEDASVVIRDRSEEPAQLGLEGLDLDLGAVRFDRGALTLLHGIEGVGTMALAALRFARTEVTVLAARLEAEGGRYALSELAFETAGSVFEKSRLDLDFNSIPFRYRLALNGRGELADILGGGAKLRLEATGFGTSSRSLTGEGVLELAPGELPDAPWVRTLVASGGVDLVGRSYAATRVDFRVDANQVVFEPFRLEAAPYTVGAEGSVDLEGPIHLSLTIADGASPARRLRLHGTFAAPELEAEP